MNKKAVVIAIILFALIIAGMFVFAYLKSVELDAPEPMPVEQNDQTDAEESAMRITAKHFFEDGTHTLAGEIAMPTPCDLLEANAVVTPGDPDQVRVDFTVINTADVCAQVITPQRFKVSFDADENADITAQFRDGPAILNLIEAGPDEDPDDFELFIKG